MHFSESVSSSQALSSPVIRSLFGCHLLQPAQACPRNLTGRLRKDKRQKINMQKAGIRWAGCSGGDTQQPHTTPESLLYIVTNKGVEQQFSGQGVTL
jgi:hypothetical protein